MSAHEVIIIKLNRNLVSSKIQKDHSYNVKKN